MTLMYDKGAENHALFKACKKILKAVIYITKCTSLHSKDFIIKYYEIKNKNKTTFFFVPGSPNKSKFADNAVVQLLSFSLTCY